MSTSARIHRLTSDIANKIAAGEVIERPANAVKELVENSLDAGARRIAIEIEEGGKKLIRVRDDGIGMNAQEQQRLFYRYWTGKEAYLKGIGLGLSLGLDRFELLFDHDGKPAQVRHTASGGMDRIWSVQSLPIEEQVAGALAIEGDGCCPQRFAAATLFR